MEPIDSLPLLIYDIFFFAFLVAFGVCSLYYANNEGFVCLNSTFPGMEVSFYRWLRVDGGILIALAIGCLWTIFQFFCCIVTYCSYIMWLIGNCLYIAWRTAWLIVGAVLFWKHIYPNGLCGTALNRYMWANLIIGFVHVVACLLFVIFYRPQPIVLMAPVVPAPMPPTMMTSQRLAFGGPGVTIGGTNPYY